MSEFSDPQWKISSSPIDYEESVSFMESRLEQIRLDRACELVWLLEHSPIYTAGVSAKDSDLLSKDSNIPIYKTSRGGQYTYHGPGIRIIYILLNLKKRYHPKIPDIRHFVQNLERWIINVLGRFSIEGEIREDRVGIWVKDPSNPNLENKIAALGIKVRQGITYHGIALNINPNFDHFKNIVPCGINNPSYGITSIHNLLPKNQTPTTKQIDRILQEEFYKIF